MMDDTLLDALAHSTIFSRRDRNRTATDEQRVSSSLLSKFLQRGRAPLPTLGIERASLEDNDLNSLISEIPESEPEIGFEKQRNLPLSREDILSGLTERAPFSIADELRGHQHESGALFDSPLEEHFIDGWVKENLPVGAGHWFIPQVSLERLLEAHGVSEGGARRIDFLFAHPSAPPLVIEIDGGEHDDEPMVDAARDEALKGCGFAVIRIPNLELERGEGPALEKVLTHCRGAFSSPAPPSEIGAKVIAAIDDCMWASKFQMALVRAIQYGWLDQGGHWSIEITGLNQRLAVAAVTDVMELLFAIDELFGLETQPVTVSICRGPSTTTLYNRYNGCFETAEGEAPEPTSKLAISIERDLGPLNDVEQWADLILRPTFLPVQLAVESSFQSNAISVACDDREQAEPLLLPFLRQIFRKREFRPLQAQSILNALRHIDSIVLLPTGAGKSIIYQLAGLLMPGVTLVVDPIVSLIEDQVEGLQIYGIDRAVGITSAMSSAEDRERLLRCIERGAYQFVLHSPERLQSPAFRNTLRALAETSKVNLAVIDEAHCVSEWGHDFRPAYLNLGRNLRSFGKDRNGSPPTLIALTGTASRSVLRDVIAELDIDRSNSDALIRPYSFDRKELHFHVTRVERTDDVNASLRGLLHGLPDKFGVPKEEFYRAAGRHTSSGIVFTPFVNGHSHGILSTKAEVRTATGVDVTNYSGSAPRGQEQDWETTKRVNVHAFKSNDVPILVSTKAFGMGIDKPNIRYTVHVGMPGSLEAFYQEAGRAGRDRRDAHCAIIYSEFDRDRSDSLLDPTISLDEARRRFEAQTQKRKNDDDISRALWFHMNSFKGSSDEIEEVEKILNLIDSLDVADTIDIPFSSGRDGGSNQEKALFRLVKVGALKDYEVLYGSRTFRVYVAPFDFEACKRSLLDYVQSAQPARVAMFSKDLDAVLPSGSKENALQLVKLLIDFTYDVIERSRRRAIQEAILLTRNADNDNEIRRRLLDYLQEGVGAEQFEALLEESNVQFEPWQEFVNQALSPVDAGEIRGMAIRSLESYPDHPGLLLVRGVSEMLCSDAEDVTSAQAIHALLSNAGKKYGIPDDQLGHTINWMTELTNSRCHQLGLPLASAILEARHEGSLTSTVDGVAESCISRIDTPEVASIRNTLKMVSVVADIKAGVGTIKEAMNDEALRKALGS